MLSISGSSAILRFLNQESAERARKRMENEDVFGNRIVVSFTPKNKELNETKSSSFVGTEKVKSPKKINKNTKLCLLNKDSNNQSAGTKGSAGRGFQIHGSIIKSTNVKSLQVLLFYLVPYSCFSLCSEGCFCYSFNLSVLLNEKLMCGDIPE